MEKDIGKISKNEQTDIVIGIREFNDRVGLDIREFTTSESYTGPTKKGLRIPADKFAEFKDMINSVNPDDLKNPTQEEPQEANEEGAESPEVSEENVADY